MSEPEQKTAVGVCTEISEKNGWTAFHIDVGSQYPVKLSTKKPEIVEAGRAVGQQTATWRYSESDGGENPNRPGTFYKNRYLNSVEAGSHAPATDMSQTGDGHAAPQRPADSTHGLLSLADKDRVGNRIACLKFAAELYAGKGSLDDEGPDVPLAVMKAAQRFEMNLYRDIDEVPFD